MVVILLRVTRLPGYLTGNILLWLICPGGHVRTCARGSKTFILLSLQHLEISGNGSCGNFEKPKGVELRLPLTAKTLLLMR
jgi:hypothetical protein